MGGLSKIGYSLGETMNPALQKWGLSQNNT
jgi:hypothetical protein